MELNYTYMLRCNDGSLYTGWTNDLEKRVRSHQRGLGGRYTHSHRPVRLVYFEQYDDSHTARSREVKIKRLSKGEKETLIENISADMRKEINRINTMICGSELE